MNSNCLEKLSGENGWKVMADECILGYLRYCVCHIFVRTALSLPLAAGSQPDTALPQLLLTGLFLKNYLNVYFGFEEGNSFYIHFPALLSNPEEQEMLFGGCFSFFLGGGGVCFVHLLIYLFYIDKSNVFCHTNLCSMSCPGPWWQFQGRDHASRGLCCSVPVHPSLVHLSRKMAVFQMLQGTWNLLLRGAVSSLCFTATTWPCLLQLLLREEEAEPRLGGGRSFGPWEVLGCYPGSSCVGISGKVLSQSKGQAWSLLSTLVWGSLLQGRPQPLWARPENWMLPNFPVQSLVPLVAGSRLFLNQVPVENWKKLSDLKTQTCGLILITLTLPFLGSKAQLMTCSPVW